MNSKRTLKKTIKRFCGRMASDAILSGTLFPEKVDEEKINEIIRELASLQENILKRVSISFFKTRRDFENGAQYNEARREYFNNAYSRLLADFLIALNDIIKKMNEAIPADIRKIVSTI